MANIKLYRTHLLRDSVYDNLMKEFFQDPVQTIKKSTSGYPLSDIYADDEGNSVIEFALAGFSREQIKVEVNDNQKLTVSVDSDTSAEQNEQRNIARRSFQKTFVDASRQYDLAGSQVTYVDGLLKIVVPKREETESLQLEVK